MRINDFFQTVFCITLELNKEKPDHPERILDSIKEFQKHGISVEFVNGVDGRELDIEEPMSSDGDSVVRKADYGCTLSHLAVAKEAKRRDLNNYFVFEDDVKLSDDFNSLFSRFIEQLPSNYRMIYAGGDNQESGGPVIGGKNIIRTRRTLTTHAYGVDRYGYKDIIKALSVHEKVDLNMTAMHRQGGCFIMNPVIAGQRPGWSYILNKEVQNEHEFFKV